MYNHYILKEINEISYIIRLDTLIVMDRSFSFGLDGKKHCLICPFTSVMDQLQCTRIFKFRQ